MSTPAGKCVFCGGHGLTKGHVWPDWLNGILPNTATHHEQETGRFYTFDARAPGPPYDLRTRQGSARSRKPRNTCLRCNSGWMSGIEGLAKRIATPLILGYSPILSPFGQFSISAFLCLIATRLEYLGDLRAITAEDRDWLRYYREPSQNWKIWVARFEGEDNENHWSRTYGVQHGDRLSPPQIIGANHCDTRISTMVIGQLCAHLIYSQDAAFVRNFDYDGIELTQIWPPRGFDFHMILSGLNGTEVLWLHETYVREARVAPYAPTTTQE